MTELFQTERLIFSRPAESHRAFYHSLFCDPVVMKHLGGALTAEQASGFLDGHLAKWAAGTMTGGVVTRKSDGSLVGIAGIGETASTTDGVLEIGYMIAIPFQGAGYATEICRGLVNFGFGIGIRKIIAAPHPENTVSRKVLEKTGFTFEREEDGNTPQFPGLTRQMIYSIQR